MIIRYSSNNSGGDWWLKDEDWKALEANGWRVVWSNEEFVFENNKHALDENGIPKTEKTKEDGYRWLGALAKYAFKDFETMGEAIREFEKLTFQDASDEGCNCCGPPHSFETLDYSQCCSGSSCLDYLYDYGPKTLREAYELLNNR